MALWKRNDPSWLEDRRAQINDAQIWIIRSFIHDFLPEKIRTDRRGISLLSFTQSRKSIREFPVWRTATYTASNYIVSTGKISRIREKDFGIIHESQLVW